MTKGTHLAQSCSANDTTLYVGDTTDFPTDGGSPVTARFIDSTNDRDVFTYTGTTATTLTGVPSSGANAVLAHTVSAANKPLVVPSIEGFYVSDTVNELRFFGDRGDGTIEELVNIGIKYDSDYILGYFGSTSSTRTAVYGQSAYTAISGHSGLGTAILGFSTWGYGGSFQSNFSYAVYAEGDSYFTGDVSALSFTDRTPFYEGDALTELCAIKSKGGQIDHDSLPGFARKTGKKHIFEERQVAQKDKVKGPRIERDGKIYERVKVGEEEEQQRDLGAMISMLTVAVQQIAERLDKLENKIS
jgi:hypothetical protein